MNVLAIECSTVQGSVAALRDGKLVFHESFVSERGHSSDLFTSLDRAVRNVGHFARIAVGLGPGSYSGVRIAIAAAMGLQFGRDAELVGLPSVLAIDTEAASYRVIGDARRGRFYFAEVQERICLEGPLLLTPEELLQKLSVSEVPVFCSASIPQFPQAELAFPSARFLGTLAALDKGISARGNLEPIYLTAPYITWPKTAR